jgi:DNA-binding CsgD family transcriptional regulator/pimeloyl-ACP methyl ester carboxylesterase
MDPPPVQFARTRDGFDIAYSVSGEGIPVVYMPQAFTSVQAMWRSLSYREQFETLAGCCRLIQYDCRGEGNSTRGLPESLTLDHYELDLEAVMSRFGNERVVLCGPMISGQVAVRYAVRHPERVRNLVLWQANLDDPLEGVRYLVDLAGQSWENFLKIPAYNFFRAEPPMEAMAILRDTMTMDDFMRQMTLPQTSIRDLLPQLKMPTLVLAIRGAYGPRVTGESEGRSIAALIPDASFVEIVPGKNSLVSSIAAYVSSLAPEIAVEEASAVPDDGDAGLSQREREVIRLLAMGRSNPEIAEELVISLNTVRRHVSNIFQKTGVSNRAQAAVYARDHHIS